MTSLPFSKMHGAGNDFVVLDLRDAADPSPELCRALADRHTGVGCDLVLGVAPPRTADAVASYRIWTADGSPSPQCGNGARCVAAWVVRAGLAPGTGFVLDSPAGTHQVDVLDDGGFRVVLAVPRFAPDDVPLTGFDAEQDRYEAEVGGRRLSFAAASVGNPHAVIEVDDVGTAPVADVGPALQGSGLFPPTVNVGFVEVVSPERIRLRVFEYGAGETLACGSGACAAAAVLIRQGRVKRDLVVSLPGGDLHVEWPDPSAPIALAGPAVFSFEGQFPHAAL
ncbi:diaminopimelate epimerase [Actinosynnema sp. NPDC047251]|uniref:Diaminopimelate epimerase n=1 Tax=Saccharothrix espanaensis (strain ATCC 51144 / DSM 44229 / JCM 9112 / NBRC 15066 / NRRL 15764) TaxID=1179773 RepID=K0K0E3_SACES|nr:diaminopimelate epimerase [Saccharothrix espanaensis]CCH31806.1 Diaminopimelate epimerase [Saccharothrix espanaensis DSM 44229]